MTKAKLVRDTSTPEKRAWWKAVEEAAAQAPKLLTEEEKPRILIWDIEATSLNADFGYMLCFGYKWYGERTTKVVSVTDFEKHGDDVTNDREVVKAALAVLDSADMWVTWYGKRFDVPFIQSRLMYHGLPVLGMKPHYDGWETARKKMRLHSNRLASVSAFLEVEEKTPLSGPIWVRAGAGHKPSIRYIRQHCKQDVIVLEQVYTRLRTIASTHPNLSIQPRALVVEGRRCPTCGHDSLISRGYVYKVTCVYQRFVCKDCGAHATGTRRERYTASAR